MVHVVGTIFHPYRPPLVTPHHPPPPPSPASPSPSAIRISAAPPTHRTSPYPSTPRTERAPSPGCTRPPPVYADRADRQNFKHRHGGPPLAPRPQYAIPTSISTAHPLHRTSAYPSTPRTERAPSPGCTRPPRVHVDRTHRQGFKHQHERAGEGLDYGDSAHSLHRAPVRVPGSWTHRQAVGYLFAIGVLSGEAAAAAGAAAVP
ncbi:hypothetical protein HYPSUDRAFT_219110 [Hypholoma sublateritium FD-334 SS-4]|uniref:Uncharacterized protein n=1 Tax=Hypholoma sublateritium (strain FD-334 SS-4) TaxID=945553 RepID=A0A0D2KQR7_HYPSF|nr:hypothetical protein HYPSUDRAFT_219110 [Hypholoma sublateritium FD-334 SS-4]